MNPLPPNADELVSAYLDGHATPDEVVLVESSPELMRRVETMRSLADLIGAPSTPPPAQKEAQISSALDAFDALFAAQDADTNPIDTTPTVAAVPTALDSQPPPFDAIPPTPEPETFNGVTSLAVARERRRPRRFNAGIIAAAAAVLLFVAVAAFGLGGGESSLDTASTPLEAADASSSAESASDSADEDAMDDDGPALSALEAAPAPTAVAPQAAEASPMIEEDAVANDEAAMDGEEAMEDRSADASDEPAESEAADDADDANAAADAEDGGGTDSESAAGATAFLVEPLKLSTEDFPDQETLRRELADLPLESVTVRVDAREQGLFPSCQEAVREFADVDEPTLIGEVRIAGDPVEIHRIIDGDTITILLVDPTNECSILPDTS